MKQALSIIILILMLLAYPLYGKAEDGIPRVAAGNIPPLELHILSSKNLSGTSGDFVTVEGEITNNSDQAAQDITTYMSLVDAGTKMPVDLEDWSAEKGLFIGTIESGQTLSLTWKIHFVQSGNYTLSVVANVEGQDMPVISKLTYFEVLAKKNLNPGHVLPVALGEPILLIFGFLALKYCRDKKYC